MFSSLPFLRDDHEGGLLTTKQEEAVPENLKNVLLIMSTNGYLVPPSRNKEREELWNETWKRIDRFLPDLRADLALDEPEVKAVPLPQGSAAEGPKVEGEKA
jgi:brefeldin A-resistance guanine nucleotide exchange factor 1